MKVAVFYGGRSVEHEVSVISALQVMKTLSLEHEVIPVYLDKNNQMFISNKLWDKNYYLLNQNNKKDTYILDNKKGYILKKKSNPFICRKFDIALLCVHGKGVEDGTLSALFEFLNIPYVGPEVSSSSIAQNKNITKQLVKSYGIPTIDHVLICSSKLTDRDIQKIESLGFPLICKANNLGSSIGIEIVNDLSELNYAIEYIFKYDTEVIVEKYIPNKCEYNISLYKSNEEIVLSDIEAVYGNNILSYEQKYLKESLVCKKEFPANIKKSLKRDIEYYAKKVYYSLEFDSLIRLDFIYDLDQNKLYLNEVNSIPGSYANYLYKNKLPFLDLLNDLIDNAINIHKRKNSLIQVINNDEIYKMENNLKLK